MRSKEKLINAEEQRKKEERTEEDRPILLSLMLASQTVMKLT
jgi:hypothetical protein